MVQLVMPFIPMVIYVNGTIGSPNATIGRPMVPLGPNATIGKVTNGTIGRTPNGANKTQTLMVHNLPPSGHLNLLPLHILLHLPNYDLQVSTQRPTQMEI